MNLPRAKSRLPELSTQTCSSAYEPPVLIFSFARSMSTLCAAPSSLPLAAAAVPRLRAKKSATHHRLFAGVVTRAAVEEPVVADVAENATASTSTSTPSLNDDVAALKKRLVSLAAASGRGQDATAAQKKAMESLVAELSDKNPTPEPTGSPLFSGDWELVYSDTFLFRSSPFFWAIGRMMGPNNADFFYEAHSHQTARTKKASPSLLSPSLSGATVAGARSSHHIKAARHFHIDIHFFYSIYKRNCVPACSNLEVLRVPVLDATTPSLHRPIPQSPQSLSPPPPPSPFSIPRPQSPGPKSPVPKLPCLTRDAHV